MNQQQKRNPKWWNQEHDSRWERVKDAFQRDWDQTKHDMGGKQPDTNQDVDDTVKQAAGDQVIPPRGQPNAEQAQDAYRFGYGARSQYGSQYPKWNDQTEADLRRDWSDTYGDRDWAQYRGEIRKGWDYDDESRTRKAA